MEKKRLAVGIPIVDHVAGEAVSELLPAVVKASRHCSGMIFLTPLNMFPHDRPRSWIVENARAAECDLLWFIDSDMILPPDSFEQLLKVQQETNAAVVSAHYYRRGAPWTSVWSQQASGTWFQVDADSGVHEIGTSGLGCALVDLKWVFENLKEPYFSMTPGEKSTIVTDDTTFYDKVRQAGGLILGNADVRCGHLGERRVVCDKTAEFYRKLTMELEKASE